MSSLAGFGAGRAELTRSRRDAAWTDVALGMTLRSLEQGKYDKTPEYVMRNLVSSIFGSIKVRSALF